MRDLVFVNGIDINDQTFASNTQGRVLVLNRSYLPIQVTSLRRAVALLCLDVAVGVDSEYQTYTWSDLITEAETITTADSFYLLRSVTVTVPIPKVLVLRDFDQRPPQVVRFSRSNVFARDRHTCHYCYETHPKQKLNIDHVIPKVQGGRTSWENVVTSCHSCNRKKGGRTPQQAGMKLLRIPKRPAAGPGFIPLNESHPVWNSFLFQPA